MRHEEWVTKDVLDSILPSDVVSYFTVRAVRGLRGVSTTETSEVRERVDSLSVAVYCGEIKNWGVTVGCTMTSHV
jgi:hypothetical protein